MTGEQVTDRWEKVPATGRKRMNTIRFDELDLNPQILRGIADMGFEEATPIQSQAIPVVLSGVDVIGQAQTGTDFTESRPVFTENAGFDFISHQRARYSGGRRNP